MGVGEEEPINKKKKYSTQKVDRKERLNDYGLFVLITFFVR